MDDNIEMPAAFKCIMDKRLNYKKIQFIPFCKIFERDTDGKYKWNGKNIRISDEVGVGKTAEASIIIRQFWDNPPENSQNELSVLLITPTRLAKNWKNELRRFVGLGVKIRPHKSRRDPIVLFTYSDFRGKTAEQKAKEYLGDRKFDLIILDEAHTIRNRGNYFNAVKYIINNNWSKKALLVFLTATPIVNGDDDMKALEDLLGNHESTATPQDSLKVDFIIKLYSVDKITDNEKTILEDAKGIGGHFPALAASSFKALYNSLENYNSVNADDEFEDSEYFDEDFEDEPSVNKPELIDSLKKELETNTKIFGRKLKMLEKILTEIIDSESNARKRAIVFCCYQGTCEEISEYISNQSEGLKDWEIISITGKTKPSKAEELITQFKDDKKTRPIVLVCTDAMSEGQNLECCHNVIHYDIPFTPAAIAQRNGRVYRNGQKSDKINVSYIKVEDSYDDDKFEIVKDKLDIVNEKIQQSEMVPLIGFGMEGNSQEKYAMSESEKVPEEKNEDDNWKKLLEEIDEEGKKYE